MWGVPYVNLCGHVNSAFGKLKFYSSYAHSNIVALISSNTRAFSPSSNTVF